MKTEDMIRRTAPCGSAPRRRACTCGPAVAYGSAVNDLAEIDALREAGPAFAFGSAVNELAGIDALSDPQRDGDAPLIGRSVNAIRRRLPWDSGAADVIRSPCRESSAVSCRTR